jgi:predicted HTH transcriptional regulator
MLEINKTARRELLELVEEGLLKIAGKGRGVKYLQKSSWRLIGD